MGLRTASVRRSHVEVMAPALTETTPQSQSFKLSPKDHIEPLNSLGIIKYNNIIINEQTDDENKYKSDGQLVLNRLEKSDNVNNLNILALVSETQQQQQEQVKCNNTSNCSELNEASDNNPTKNNFNNMNNSLITSMGDQTGDDNNKMGLQKTGSVSKLNNKKTTTQTSSLEVEQILNNLTSSLPSAGDIVGGGGGDVCSSVSGDLSQNVDDLMQVIKSIENSEVNEEEVFNMGGTDLTNNLTIEKLLNDVDNIMNISIEEQPETNLKETQSKDLIVELKNKLAKVERRLEFLRRKTIKLQAKHMGQHVSGEISGVFDYVQRSFKRIKQDNNETTTTTSNNNNNNSSSGINSVSLNDFKPISYGSTKTLLKKLEMTTILQTNSVTKHRNVTNRYFGSGSLELAPCRNNVTGMVNIPAWPIEYKQELQKVSGLLNTELKFIQHEYDSDATESSSGGESCDEMQSYSNPHQQYLSIQKRALWKYLVIRAAIASRWTWLQAQISDLEYRIRQHKELHRKIRSTKGAIILEGINPPDNSTGMVPSSPTTTTVNGYRGQLPGSSPISLKLIDNNNGTTTTTQTVNGIHPDYQSARTRPLVNFKKRKLLLTSSLHIVAKKAARPSTIRCGCVQPVSCALCTGRIDPTYPRDSSETLSKSERIALLDPSFHPVISMPEDVSCGIHTDAILKIPDCQQRSTRMKSLKLMKNERVDKSLLNKNIDHRKKTDHRLKSTTMTALTAKLNNKLRGRGKMSAAYRFHKKRNSTSKLTAMQQLQSLNATNNTSTDGADDDEEVEATIGNNNVSNTNNISQTTTTTTTVESPTSSPLLHIQTISGYNRRNRTNSYDIDNIVIPYSVAASTRVEKLQYKEILTPKWRIAEPDFKCDTKNNGAVRNPSQDSDAEDLTEEAVIIRHDKCEYDEKKKFLSYIKFPLGYGRSRAHKRTDSLAESSGANTPDPMSPHPIDNNNIHENTNSPLTTPPATPLSIHVDDSIIPSKLPSISAIRRRTTSQSRFIKDRDNINREDSNNTPENIDVPPYESRLFPIDDETYNKMLKNMPENHQFQTNIRAQDSNDCNNTMNYLDDKVGSPGSETTESAVGDEDPNDPEWVDLDRSRDRHKR